MIQPTCQIAFKEWAAVCEALAAGRQTIILRKGGLQDEIERIRIAAHHGFWLYPTNFHQQAENLSSDAWEFIERALATKPTVGQVALRLYATLDSLSEMTTEERALRLQGLHIWSQATVRQRFAYRFPLLFVLGVRIHALPKAVLVAESPELAGCKSWVTLPEPISTDGLLPVLTDEQYVKLRKEVMTALA